MKLRRATWALSRVWGTLKADFRQCPSADFARFREVEMYRHEMQHFLTVLQGYLANQVSTLNR